jgi:lipid A 3-O-deacylase
MRARYLIIIITIVSVGLFHFTAEAADSGTKSIDKASTSADLSVNSKTRDSEEDPVNNFSRGAQKWQTYASAAGCDHGKGEMYAAHFGYGYFLRDYLSVNIDVLGAYIRSGLDDNGVGVGLDVIFRRHFSWVDDDFWTFYLDIGGGLQQQSTHFSGSRHFNFRVMGGGGGTIRVSDRVRLMGGIRYLHISDAGIEGGGGGLDGLMFYAGAMFPF